MSATNKTPNMELPIYVPEDKPTYLGDWNSTMSKIDTTVTATRNVADSAMETASNASNGVATNTESIGALQTDVQLVKSNQTAINEHLTDIDNSITALDAKATKTTSQLSSGDIAFQFGVDSDGNYGYIKAGADTVTPFKSGSEFPNTVTFNLTSPQAQGSGGITVTQPLNLSIPTLGYSKADITVGGNTGNATISNTTGSTGENIDISKMEEIAFSSTTGNITANSNFYYQITVTLHN